MKKGKAKASEDDLHAEYDLSKVKGGGRGKYLERYRAGINLALLAPDVRATSRPTMSTAQKEVEVAELVLTDVEEVFLHQLQERAKHHGRTLAEEAKSILSEALQSQSQQVWDQVDAIYRRLAMSGGGFSDSADLLHEDRNR